MKVGRYVNYNTHATELIEKSAHSIICSAGMQSEKQYIHHRNISCYEHSIGVAYMSICIALRLHLKVNMKSLIRGALLHDYFLYDWHEPDESHELHGFIHAGRALKNAERDFELNDIERDIISKHMFPLNPQPPKYVESVVVTVADKICATRELFSAKALSVVRR